jgi:hypothetical protein
METTYSIINISVDPAVPLEGLTGLTHDEAMSWMINMNDIINYTIKEDIL